MKVKKSDVNVGNFKSAFVFLDKLLNPISNFS